MFMADIESFRNHVVVAVERLGGATKAAHAVKVSNASVHSWIRNRRVPNIDTARLLAELTGMDVQMLRPTR